MRKANTIARRCKRLLEHHYGTQFRGLVLYGSVARKQAVPDSDIDLFVLLAKPFDFSRELHQIVDVLYPVQLESDRLISALPAAYQMSLSEGRVTLIRRHRLRELRAEERLRRDDA